MPDPTASPRATAGNAWTWVPSLYFAQGIPYVVAMSVSVVLYKNLGISNRDIAVYTSWLYLPWVIKPLWSPVVDLFATKRRWVVVMQAVIAVLLASVALTIPAPHFFQYTLAFLWLMAFASATHDIAADGFYMLGLQEHQQAAFVGVRSTFYRIAMITGEGVLVVLAGEIEGRARRGLAFAWSVTFFVIAAIFAAAFLYHAFVLPRPVADRRRPRDPPGGFLTEFFRVFATFLTKRGLVLAVAFLLLYRFAEAQLVKMIAPFLLDSPAAGGLGLTTAQVGIAKGAVGVVGLLCGGILGGVLISRYGLRRCLWPMVISINLPGWVYILLATFQPKGLVVISAAVGVEQFAYGFGFSAYMLYMIFIAGGEHKTAHYAICTGFMALGMMLPGMLSGWMQEMLGYRNFFLWVIASTIPCFVVSSLIRVPDEFGRKRPPPAPSPRCEVCEYDLTGNVSGVCPECGAPVQRPDSSEKT